MFQSSSSPKTGCNTSPTVKELIPRFQSSSSPKTGCNLDCSRTPRGLLGSNPHPARRLDAIYIDFSSFIAKRLFQSSSSPKTGCNVDRRFCHVLNSAVPILIQPEDWMQYQYVQLLRVRLMLKGSNPHPARRLDAIPPIVFMPGLPPLFQSSSSPKTGCN